MTYLVGTRSGTTAQAGAASLGALNTTAAAGRKRWYDGNLLLHNSIREYAVVTGNLPYSVRSYSPRGKRCDTWALRQE